VPRQALNALAEARAELLNSAEVLALLVTLRKLFHRSAAAERAPDVPPPARPRCLCAWGA